jgi:hypothetical protein
MVGFISIPLLVIQTLEVMDSSNATVRFGEKNRWAKLCSKI